VLGGAQCVLVLNRYLIDIPCLGSDSSGSGSGSRFSSGGSRSESEASESGSELEPPPARKKLKSGKGKQQPEVRQSKQGIKSTASRSDTSGSTSRVNTANRRKSIKDSKFVDKYSYLLKPLYKYYQAMHLATHGALFQWEACHREHCVHLLLDAAKELHSPDDYTILKKAVEEELHDGRPR